MTTIRTISARNGHQRTGKGREKERNREETEEQIMETEATDGCHDVGV